MRLRAFERRRFNHFLLCCKALPLHLILQLNVQDFFFIAKNLHIVITDLEGLLKEKPAGEEPAGPGGSRTAGGTQSRTTPCKTVCVGTGCTGSYPTTIQSAQFHTASQALLQLFLDVPLCAIVVLLPNDLQKLGFVGAICRILHGKHQSLCTQVLFEAFQTGGW